MGQAGVGIAMNIRAQLKAEGLSDEEARARIFASISRACCSTTRPACRSGSGRSRSRARPWPAGSCGIPNAIRLMDVVGNAKPTVLIGVTAQTGLFSGECSRRWRPYEKRPIVLALSNPTSKCECTPDDVAKATNGTGLVATGSPFPDIPWGDRVLVTSQCNNLYVFPGVGLGALVAKAPKVTHEMFLAASRALSAMVTPEQEAKGHLLPAMRDIRAVSRGVAKAVAIEARDSGLGRLLDDAKYEEVIARAQWEPKYTPYRPGKTHVLGCFRSSPWTRSPQRPVHGLEWRGRTARHRGDPASANTPPQRAVPPSV